MRRAAVGVVALCMLAAATWALAQSPFKAPEPFNVLSGSDIGFRVERTEGNRAFGKLVVRVNGKWVETAATPGIVPVQGK